MIEPLPDALAATEPVYPVARGSATRPDGAVQRKATVVVAVESKPTAVRPSAELPEAMDVPPGGVPRPVKVWARAGEAKARIAQIARMRGLPQQNTSRRGNLKERMRKSDRPILRTCRRR